MDSAVYSQSNWIAIKVAELHYIQGKSQKEIASLLNISESTTSRLVRRAREEGIVGFVIRDPYMNCISLANDLKENFGLKDVVVVPTGKVPPLSVRMMVARESANYLQRVLNPDDILGISWGRTVFHLFQYFDIRQRFNIPFISLHGCDTRAFSAALQTTNALGGKNYTIICEDFFASENPDRIKHDEITKGIFAFFDQITISISGVGSLYPVTESLLFKHLSSEQIESILNMDAYGEMMLRFFDKDGQECKSGFADHAMSISFEKYRKIPRKIVVASGANKAHAISAVLRGKLADVLIVDYDLAKGILELP
ncbi:MAG: sugar-binding transcriptional regulator [Bacillota bacterium]